MGGSRRSTISVLIVWLCDLTSVKAYPPVIAYCLRVMEVREPFFSITLKVALDGVIGIWPFGTTSRLASRSSTKTDETSVGLSGSKKTTTGG